MGAYGSLTDYFKVLRSLLLDDEKLLRRATARLMFEPQLPTQAATDGLRAAFEDPSWAVGDFSSPRELDSAYGGLLVVGDAHPFRMRGHLSWSGAANLYWVRKNTYGRDRLGKDWLTHILPVHRSWRWCMRGLGHAGPSPGRRGCRAANQCF